MRSISLSAIVTSVTILTIVLVLLLLAWFTYRPEPFHEQPVAGLDRYALVVGVARYSRLPSRPDYEQEARAMARHAVDAGFALIGGGPVLNPSEQELMRSVDTLGRLTESGAEVFVYFAGHAVPGENTIFLLAADSRPPPLVRYAEGGLRLEEIWSHPSGGGPSRTTVVIETEGVGGLFEAGFSGFGTGLDTLEVNDNVVVAISDHGGPVEIRGEAFHRMAPARPRLMFDNRPEGLVRPASFTPVIIELDTLRATDIAAALQRASLEVHERSSGQLSPVIFASRYLTALPPLRPEPAPLATADAASLADRGEPAAINPAPSFAADSPVADDTVLLAATIPLPSLADSVSGLSVVALIQMFEAFRAETYLDAAGIPTIGFGHTGSAAGSGSVITREVAMDLLMDDIDTATLAVDAAVSRPLTDNQRNALVSLAFNIGGEALRNSTLIRLINSDIHSVSAAQFLRWVHVRVPGGGMRVLRGLESRRQLEAFLFLVEEDSVTATDLIISFEPFRPSAIRAHNCSVVGYGRALRPCAEEFDTRISQVEALQYLRRELVQIEQDIRAVVSVPVSQAQIAGLVSFVHQNGMEAFESSQILSRLNRTDYAGAANALRLHDAFLGGPGMDLGESRIERRAAEAALFFAHGGEYIAEPMEARP